MSVSGRIGARSPKSWSPIFWADFLSISDEWRELYQKELRKWGRQLWRRRFQRFGLNVKREQVKLREKYSNSWMKREWPSPGSATERVDFYDWHAEGLQARFWAMKRVHQRLLWRCIKELRPASVLEVGFGNGINLLALSTAFPGVRWGGVRALSWRRRPRQRGAARAGVASGYHVVLLLAERCSVGIPRY